MSAMHRGRVTRKSPCRGFEGASEDQIVEAAAAAADDGAAVGIEDEGRSDDEYDGACSSCICVVKVAGVTGTPSMASLSMKSASSCGGAAAAVTLRTLPPDDDDDA